MEGLQYTQNSMPPSLRSLKRTLQLWADSCANKSFCFERNLYSQKMIFLAGMSFVFMIGDLWSVIHGAIEGPPPIKSANDTHPPLHSPPTKKGRKRERWQFLQGLPDMAKETSKLRLKLKKLRSVSTAKWQPLNSEVIPWSWAARKGRPSSLLLR